MNYAIVENGIVVNIVVATADFAASQGWIEIQNEARIGWIYEDGQFSQPPCLPGTIELDILSTDVWTIPANSETVATVTYTDTDTVYFSVNETVHAVEPVEQIATLEITANAPGPIRVEVKAKQLIITAIEVPL